MRVLVTGASGFVGTWLANRLVDLGLDVRIVMRSAKATPELNSQRMQVFSGDVTDVTSLTKACEGVHSVFHLAGVVGYSRAERALMDHVNVTGTANILQAAQTAKVSRFVHMSSVVAVGASFDGTPLNEDSPYNVGHLNLGYFETKYQAEQLVRQVFKEGRLDTVMLNPSTIYGAGDARKGSRKTQLKVARGKFPFYTSGGVSIVAVEDVVEALITAWKKGRSGERYILSGDNLTIRELFQTIADAAGVAPPSIYLPNVAVRTLGKVGDLMEKIGRKGPINSENAWTSILYHWFDSSKARRELGFQPKPGKLAIANSVQWMKEQGLLHPQD